MAKTPKPVGGGSTPADIDADAQYRVTLRRPVAMANGRIIKPRNDNIVKGKVIAQLGDAVESYEKV